LQNQKNVQAFRIMPIKELNEVTHHILDCMNASIYYSTKGSGIGGGGVGHMDSMDNPLKGSHLSGAGGDQSMGGGGGSSGLTGIFQAVNNFVKQAKNSEGLHFREICAYFKHIPESKIR
jgi:hypothetical protein